MHAKCTGATASVVLAPLQQKISNQLGRGMQATSSGMRALVFSNLQKLKVRKRQAPAADKQLAPGWLFYHELVYECVCMRSNNRVSHLGEIARRGCTFHDCGSASPFRVCCCHSTRKRRVHSKGVDIINFQESLTNKLCSRY